MADARVSGNCLSQDVVARNETSEASRRSLPGGHASRQEGTYQKSRPEGRLSAPTGSESLSGFPQRRGILNERPVLHVGSRDHVGTTSVCEVLLRLIRSLYADKVSVEADDHHLHAASTGLPNLPDVNFHLNLLAIGTLTRASYHGGKA